MDAHRYIARGGKVYARTENGGEECGTALTANGRDLEDRALSEARGQRAVGRPRRAIRTSGNGDLEVRADVYRVGSLDYTSETIARFRLEYLPDSHEVVLLREDIDGGDTEAVYSELLERGAEK